MIALFVIRSWPAGATIRPTLLPQPSIKVSTGTYGKKFRISACCRSLSREGWTYSISSIGVGAGNSKIRSKPIRINMDYFLVVAEGGGYPKLTGNGQHGKSE